MAWKKPEYSLDEVSQTFNLKELLNREPTEADKSEFLERAVDLIVERTQSGKPLGGHGSQFEKYSEKYAEWKGVSVNEVDLTLEQDMLDSIEGEDLGAGEIKIKVGEGLETKKAYNHNVGDTLPKRTFFGLTQKEAKAIAGQIGVTKKARRTTQEPRRQTVGDLLRTLGGITLERVEDDNGG